MDSNPERSTPPPPANRKALQSEATRKALLEAATALFAERGYAGTYTDEVARRAGVTRGALYHQFRDKRALFRAAAGQLALDLVERVRARSRPSKAAGAWARLHAGCDAALDALQDPAVRRIVLVDAPAVLGWQEWRALQAQAFLGYVRRALAGVQREGRLDAPNVEPLAHLVTAFLIEAALMIAHAEDPVAARGEIGATVARLLDGLQPDR